MGLRNLGRRIFDTFVRQRMTRLDRHVFHAREGEGCFFPSFTQLSHLDIFLVRWERLVIAAAAALFIVSLVGIVWSIRNLTTVAVAADGGSFKEVLVGEPRTINPVFAASDVDRTLTNIFFLPLCGTAGRQLAQECTVNDAMTRATITLGDHHWHDGTPITAQDVLFTMQSLQNESIGSPWYPLAQKINIAIDKKGSIEIIAGRPLPELNTLLHLGIIPSHVWKNIEPTRMRSSTHNLKPIGSGPFQFSSASTDADEFLQSMTLKVFSDFKPAPAHLKELTFRFAPDTETAADMFRTRSVDAWVSFDPTEGDAVFKHDVKRYELTPPIVVSLFFNPSKNPVFKNADTRDAFALIVDRTTLIKNILHSDGVPQRAPFPQSYLSEEVALLPDTDADASRALLKKTFPKMASSTLSLGVPATISFDAVAKYIAQNFSALGITVVPHTVDLETNPVDAFSYDMLLAGHTYETPNSAFPYWHSSGSGVTGANYARYQIREVDQWLELLAAEPKPEQRTALLKKISNRLVADTPAVFLYQPVYEYFVTQKINGIAVAPGAAAENRFDGVTEWYIETEHVRK